MDPEHRWQMRWLARLLTRRQVMGAGGLLAVVTAVRGIGGGMSAARQATVVPTAAPNTYQGQPTVIGTAGAQVTGPAMTEVGPAPEQATPIAGVDFAAFMATSATLVGGGQLDPQRGKQLLDLIAGDASQRAALNELLALNGVATAHVATPFAALSATARDLGREILQFWYLGTYRAQPVTGRESFWFGLSSWQAVKYTPAPSLCKGFGFWTRLPSVS